MVIPHLRGGGSSNLWSKSPYHRKGPNLSTPTHSITNSSSHHVSCTYLTNLDYAESEKRIRCKITMPAQWHFRRWFSRDFDRTIKIPKFLALDGIIPQPNSYLTANYFDGLNQLGSPTTAGFSTRLILLFVLQKILQLIQIQLTSWLYCILFNCKIQPRASFELRLTMIIKNQKSYLLFINVLQSS